MTATVRPYDFRYRETLERRHINALHEAFEGLARHATVELSTLLGSAKLSVRQVAERPWHSVVSHLGDQPYVGTFRLDPLGGEAVVGLDGSVALRIVDLRLGGGSHSGYTGHTTATSTDLAVFAGIVTPIIELLAAGLERIAPVTATLVGQDMSSQYIQMSGPDEMFVVADIELTVARDTATDLAVALPVALVRQLADPIDANPTDAGGYRQVEAAVLLQTPIELSVEIPPVELTPQEISDLAVGDVIPLMHPLDRALDVRAGGVLVARANQGHVGSKIVCSIVEEVQEDEC